MRHRHQYVCSRFPVRDSADLQAVTAALQGCSSVVAALLRCGHRRTVQATTIVAP
ncbi:hypothetical protein HanRHA438_Chr00c72g0862501 [Helianthus annuus]|nr:hypothetical protein HanRHA438_Chr00c72g0862501 [Helianthus annuus]